MQRLAGSIAFLSVSLSVSLSSSLAVSLAALSGCASQECFSRNDCDSGKMCSLDGTCINEDSAPLSARSGSDMTGVGTGGGVDRDGRLTIGAVTAPDEAIWAGGIGPVDGFDGPAYFQVNNDVDFGSTMITVNGTTSDGSGLFILFLPNGIENLPLGAWNLTAADSIDGGTYVQLCSDTDSGEHFDGFPEETFVDVTPNDDGFAVDVKTSITNGFDGYNDGGGQPTVLRVGFQLTAL